MHTVPQHRIAGALVLTALVGLAACGQDSAQELVAKAQTSLASGDPKSAIVNLKNALQLDPSAVATRVLLGKALLADGDAASAATELSKSIDQQAKPVDVMPALAKAMVLSGQHKKLVALYGDVILEEKGADAAFRTSLATAWALAGDRAKSEAAISAALAAVPDLTDALVLRARLMAGRGEFDPALALVDQVLQRDARAHEAWHLKGEIQAYARGDIAGAEASFRKAVELDKTYVPAQVALAGTRIRANDLPGAKKQLEALRAVAPNVPDTLFVDAQVAYFEKDYPRARELAQRLLRIAPDNTGILQLAAAIEWQSGSMVVAGSQLATAVKLDPTLVEARANLAHVYLRLRQPERALETIKPVLESTSPGPSALAAAAEASLQLGRVDDAEVLFSRAASASPDDAASRTALALTRLAKGDAAAAFSQLEALAQQSKDAYADAALVSARLRRNELDAALAAADNMVRKLPDNAAAHELRGRVLRARRDEPGARQAFEKALSIEPRLLSAVASLVELDTQEKLPEQARKRLQTYLTSEPRSFPAWLLLADLRQRQGAPAAEVREALDQAVKAAPNEPAPRVKLVAFLANSRQTKAALAAAQEAQAAIPDSVDVLDALGQMQLADGDRRQALSTFRRVTVLDPKVAAAHVRMASVYMADGERSAAAASLRRAIEIDPRLRQARIGLVDLLVDQKRSKEAIEIARDLQRREPTSSGGYLLEGAVQRKLKNEQLAITAYRLGLQKAVDGNELALNMLVSMIRVSDWKQTEAFALDWLKKHPGDGPVHYTLGEGYMVQGAYAAAERQFLAALSLRPDYPQALNNLAWVMVKQGKTGAVEMAQKALAVAPDSPSFLDTLAMAQAAAKQLPEALETQRKAVKLAPNDPALRLQLAKLALESGDKPLAKSELDRLLAMGSRNPFRDEAARLSKGL